METLKAINAASVVAKFLLIAVLMGSATDLHGQTSISIRDTSGNKSFNYSLVNIITLDTGCIQKPGNVDVTLKKNYGSSLLGNIRKVIYTDSVIVIWESPVPDVNNIYFFTGNGQYLKKINRGKGPNEITNVQNLVSSPSGEKIA